MATHHVYPVNDLVEHQLSDACVCGPTPRLEEGGWISIHHALDGREFGEPDYTGPPIPKET